MAPSGGHFIHQTKILFLLPIAQDIVDGRELLNLAFVANLFNKYPALDLDYVDESKIEETREEKSKFEYDVLKITTVVAAC